MQKTLLLLFICIVTGWKHSNFWYDQEGPRILDIYLDNAPTNIASNEVIDIIESAMNAWNMIPRNTIHIQIGDIHRHGHACILPRVPSLYTREILPRGVICFVKDSSARTLTNFTLKLIQNVFLINSASVFINQNVFINKKTLYNVFLHEFGHINLLKHPDNISGWIWLKNPKKEEPVMKMILTYDVNTDELKKHDNYAQLSIDDIVGVMSRPEI